MELELALFSAFHFHFRTGWAVFPRIFIELVLNSADILLFCFFLGLWAQGPYLYLIFCHIYSHSHIHSALCNVYPVTLDRNRWQTLPISLWLWLWLWLWQKNKVQCPSLKVFNTELSLLLNTKNFKKIGICPASKF